MMKIYHILRQPEFYSQPQNFAQAEWVHSKTWTGLAGPGSPDRAYWTGLCSRLKIYHVYRLFHICVCLSVCLLAVQVKSIYGQFWKISLTEFVVVAPSQGSLVQYFKSKGHCIDFGLVRLSVCLPIPPSL